jgi:Ni/Fe-hydrogenase 1 B-type cytochrome subunit
MATAQTQESRHTRQQRILHEILITSIILLILTGFYIHYPFATGIGFMMSVVRGLHFFCAAVMIVAALVRVGYMFFGSARDSRQFIPNRDDFKKLPAIINYYAYIGKEPVITKKYNPLQMISYCLAMILVLFQIISGLALLYPESWMSWFNYYIFGSEVQVRIAHDIVTWLLVIFIMVHFYMAIREPHPIKDMHFFLNKDEG